eukprot:CAMPEP_0182472742 /NCGR_PEP_ID=MMETSP1319-20130603/22772_1 /TAXON_ID=172717 /ORGANISM="Bolidomonas pacifica, Strain RCC208" /LENGTH=105 /DNA_ID=CAMNT_0024673477 /DNA_START=93 /DNA_END=407 /DNA_ORIENTATION=+
MSSPPSSSPARSCSPPSSPVPLPPFAASPTDTPDTLLIELLKAVKFANPTYGVNKLHAYISLHHSSHLSSYASSRAEPWDGLKKGRVKTLYKKLGLSDYRQGLSG